LGCVIEESLVNPTSAATATTATATSTATNHIVFVTSVTANGFAEKAGLLVGDVIVGVSTAFTTSSTDTKSDEECHLSSSSTTIMDVTGFGIDRVYVANSSLLIASRLQPYLTSQNVRRTLLAANHWSCADMTLSLLLYGFFVVQQPYKIMKPH
jgi:hypothetical protein